MMLEFHPLANLFPLIEGAEFDALVDDMRANGYRSGEEIVLFEAKILDGRNRYRAAIAAGLLKDEEGRGTSWHFLEFGTEGIDGCFSDHEVEMGPLAYVISKNLHRRHLNESQRAMVAARLATMRQGERTDLSNNRKPSANLPKVEQAAAAETLKVSERTLRSAKQVQDHGTPELQRAVDGGKLAVSAAAQAAKLSPERQGAIAREAEAGHANAVRNVIKRETRAGREAELGARQRELPDKKFGVILADPEWEFTTFSAVTGMDRSPANHYPTSTEKEISARDVQKISAKDCLLALWVTDLARGIRVMEMWGFEYKSYFVWVKDIVPIIEDGAGRMFKEVGPAGTGYWNRDRDELLLIGTRGQVPAPAMGTQGESVIFAARPRLEGATRGRHSAKPAEVHEWLERHYPTLPKIELNSRAARPGWECWGFEAPQETLPAHDPETGEIHEDKAPQDSNAPAQFSVDELVELARQAEPADQTVEVPPPRRPSLMDDDFEIPTFLRRTPEPAS